MVGIFALCGNTVVATGTALPCIGMRKCCRGPGTDAVTVLTGITGWNMCGRFSSRAGAIMATAAIGCYRWMAEIAGPPGIRIVTFLAGLARRDMMTRFARRRASIVAGGTPAADVGMAETGAAPGRRAVTDITGNRRRHRYMAGRQAHGLAAIVTGSAGPEHAGMIDAQHGFPAIAIMTIRTIVRTGHMLAALAAGSGKFVSRGMTAFAI